MGLETLEFLEWREVGVGVAQPDDEADRHLMVFHVVEERAAVGAGVQRPADGVDDLARNVLGGIDFPQFLDADAVGLRVHPLAQFEALEQDLGERAPAAFGEQGVAGAQFHAGRVLVGRLAFAVDAHVAGGDPDHGPLIVVEHFGGGEAGINFHPQFLGLRRQPAAQVAQADDVVAVIVHLRRGGEFIGGFAGQQQEAVVRGRGIQRRALVLPIGDQLVQGARFDHRAG